MSSPNETQVIIKVSLWSESEKSWHFLVKEGVSPGAFSTGVWFPKKCCIYDKEAATLTVPLWLFNDKKLNNLATIVEVVKYED